MERPNRRAAVPAMLFITAAPFAVVLAWLIGRGHVPAQIPETPSLFGTLASASTAETVAWDAVRITSIEVVVVWLLFLLPLPWRSYRWLNFAAGLVWVGAGMPIATLLGSIGADSYADAVDRNWPFLLQCALFAVALSGVGFLVRVPRVTQSNRQLPSSTLHLKPSERAIWTGSAARPRSFAIGVVVAAIGVLLIPVSIWFMALSVAGLGLANASAVRVMIDGDGITMRLRWTPWSFARVPLDEIATAEVTRHQSAWREFEYRADASGRKARVRAGEALELQLHNDTTYSVSLDHAAQAADVVNALIVRLRTANDPSLRSS
jgi:hypothetical protein